MLSQFISLYINYIWNQFVYEMKYSNISEKLVSQNKKELNYAIPHSGF